MKRTSEAAFETAIEDVLLKAGYESLESTAFDRERAIFPEPALDFIQSTQPKVWKKLEALHGDETGERVLAALCKWMNTHGALATLRHGFKCFGKMISGIHKYDIHFRRIYGQEIGKVRPAPLH